MLLSEVRELIRVREKAERDYNSAILQARMEEQEKAKKALEKEKAKAQKAIEKERQKAEQEKARARQEKIKSAKKMLKKGFDISDIAEISGFSIDELLSFK